MNDTNNNLASQMSDTTYTLATQADDIAEAVDNYETEVDEAIDNMGIDTEDNPISEPTKIEVQSEEAGGMQMPQKSNQEEVSEMPAQNEEASSSVAQAQRPW